MLPIFRILVMFCSGAIERTAAGRLSAESEQPCRKCCVFFSILQFCLECDRALYQTAVAVVCEFFFLFLVFIFFLLF
jgi:hypothetical protein